MTIRSTLRKYAFTLARPATSIYYKVGPTRKAAAALYEKLSQTSSIADRVAIVRQHQDFRTNQKPKEIEALLARVSELRPNCICEIGADRGGSLTLFASVAQPTAKILSIDLRYAVIIRQCNQFLVGRDQRLVCIEADSHSVETLSKAKSSLENQQIDFLFIDGDHSYDGVKADFDMYGPLVRSGGIIAFHDIAPDSMMRHGRPSSGDVGQVPIFWQEIRSKFPNSEELIEDPEQDGYGIGVVRVP